MPEDGNDELAVYLAGPVAAAPDSGRAWRETVIDEYGDEFEFLNPLDKYDPEDEQDWRATRIVEDDLALIDQADAVLVRYNGAPTWGTPMEVHYAQTVADIPAVVAWTVDAPLSPWAQTFATAVRPCVADAIGALRRYLRDEHIGWIEGVEPYDADADIQAAFDATESDERAPAPSGSMRVSGDDLAGAVAEDLAALLTDSRDTHGDAVANQEHIAEAWEWLFRYKLHGEASISGADVSRAMQLVKLSRLTVGEYDVDHDRDVSGYGCIAAACEATVGEADPEDLREHTDWDEDGDAP